jgi:hypothetical protein
MSSEEQAIEIRALHSKKHVITITAGEKSYKIFQISFQKDGSFLCIFHIMLIPMGLPA